MRAKTAEDWAHRVMKLPKMPKDEHPAPVLVSLCRLTGDRQFDLPEGTRKKVEAFLVERGVPEDQLTPLREVIAVDTKTEAQAFGEGLPVGLTLA